MKLTLGDARAISMGLPEVMKAKLPVKMAYWFSRTLRELGEHLKDMEKTREKMVEVHAKKYTKDKKDPKTGDLIEEKGKPVSVNNQYVFKDKDKWDEEWEKLCDQEIEIKYDGVTLAELEKLVGEQGCPECKKKIPSEVVFKGLDIFNLGILVRDPEEEKKEEEKK